MTRIPRAHWPGIPADTVAMLRRMRDTEDPRLNATLRRAEARGWRQTELAEALEITRQSLYKRINRPDREAEAVPIPDPRPPAETVRPAALTVEQVEELRRLAREAAPRGGRISPAAAPARDATRRLGELLDGYVRAGHRAMDIAAAMQVHPGVVRSRVHRWRQQHQATERGKV